VAVYNALFLEDTVTELLRKETETGDVRWTRLAAQLDGEPQLGRLPLHQLADRFVRPIQ
jgi:hypothetical protein